MGARDIKDSGTFDAADEQSETMDVRRADIHIIDAGSFSGTIVLYRIIAGSSVVVDTITEAEMPYDKVIENATIAGTYLKCTARSAGSANYYMQGE